MSAAGKGETGDAEEAPYGLGAVARLTGLSDHAIRAWERRYGAVRPRRTPGGTRRYTEREVGRLRRLRAAVEAGHRIGDVAELDDAALERLVARAPGPGESAAPRPPGQELLEAADALDLRRLESLLTMEMHTLGPATFAREVAAPLLRKLGERWERGESSVAAEHLASSVVRSLLGAALRAGGGPGPRILFTTPEGERHELGSLIAAVVAVGAGADVAYLGPDLPVDELVAAAERLRPAAVALSAVGLAPGLLRRYLTPLRRRLPERVALWIGGSRQCPEVPGVTRIEDLDELPRRIALLRRLS